MFSLRRTKIVATLGPALDAHDAINQALNLGVNIFRANFSHGSAAIHQERIAVVRSLAAEKGLIVAILADMQGPKIRIARFKHDSVHLKDGDIFTLDPNLGDDAGDEQVVGLDYKMLAADVRVNDVLLLDDGRITLLVKEIVTNNTVVCTVLAGGVLSNNKGINRLGGGLSAGAITSKDCADMKIAAEMQVDFVAISFPRSGDDIKQARKWLTQAGSNAQIIAKIERAEAITNIVDIMQAADGIMIARGDLGVEIGDAELPGIQKNIIKQANIFAKPVITATQMLESMINSTIPTRAEVSDVANAVLDGSDAVMLSAETASGSYPVKAIAAMDRICLSAEKYLSTTDHTADCTKMLQDVDHAIAAATMFTAKHMKLKAIIALTESGTTPLLMSRIYANIPIYGLSRHQETLRLMSLYRGVSPIYFDATCFDRRELNYAAVKSLEEAGVLDLGDLVAITKGDLIGVHGRTNSMKIVTVGEICNFLP